MSYFYTTITIYSKSNNLEGLHHYNLRVKMQSKIPVKPNKEWLESKTMRHAVE